MKHAKRLAILVLAASAMGCCPSRWPSQAELTPSKAFIRYVAAAVKDGDTRCAKESKTIPQAEECIYVYGELKTLLIKLEGQ